MMLLKNYTLSGSDNFDDFSYVSKTSAINYAKILMKRLFPNTTVDNDIIIEEKQDQENTSTQTV